MADMDSFNDRIARINRGRQWAPEGVVHQPVQARGRGRARGRHGQPGLFARLFHAVSLPVTLAVGLAAVLIARWARFKLSGLPEEGHVLMQPALMDAGAALAIAFVLTQVFSMRSVTQMACTVAGVAAGVLGMHLAVHQAPGLFAEVFSPAWVSAVISQTDPRGVLFLDLGKLPV